MKPYCGTPPYLLHHLTSDNHSSANDQLPIEAENDFHTPTPERTDPVTNTLSCENASSVMLWRNPCTAKYNIFSSTEYKSPSHEVDLGQLIGYFSSVTQLAQRPIRRATSRECSRSSSASSSREPGARCPGILCRMLLRCRMIRSGGALNFVFGLFILQIQSNQPHCEVHHKVHNRFPSTVGRNGREYLIR